MEKETIKAFETFLPIFEFGLQRMYGSERRIYLAQIAKQMGYGGIFHIQVYKFEKNESTNQIIGHF